MCLSMDLRNKIDIALFRQFINLNKKYIILFIDDPDDEPSPKLIDQKQQSAFLFTLGQYGGETTHQLRFTFVRQYNN